MRAAYIEAHGSAESIKYGTLPTPVPGPTDVLVEVDAVAVNNVDTFVRSGAYETPVPFPFVIGRDLVGTVAAVGAGVVDFAVGEAVWSNSLGHAGRQGAAAEYAVVPGDRLYHLPDGVDPLTAVALVHPTATAYLALAVHGLLRAGETVLVAGAAGHVGRAATVLARRAGARVVATASRADLEVCRRLGAEVAVDYRDPDLAGALHRAAMDGVDVHLDTSGHHDLDLAVGLLAPRGRIVLMAGLAARPELPVGAVYTRDARIIGFAISTASTADLAAAAERVNQLLAEGTLDPRSGRGAPAERGRRSTSTTRDGPGSRRAARAPAIRLTGHDKTSPIAAGAGGLVNARRVPMHRPRPPWPRHAPRPDRREVSRSAMRPPPSTTAAIGTGSLVRRRPVVAASITVDHEATEVAKGTVARFHGSSVSGMTVNTWSPGLFRNQPPVNPASKIGERLDGSGTRQARATPAPRITAPRSHLHRSTSASIVSCQPLRGNDHPAHRHECACHQRHYAGDR